MAFDDVFDHLNGLGWYQVSLYLLLGLPSFYGGVQSILMTFLGPDQDHWCYVERLEGFCYEIQKEVAIPKNDDDEYERCSYFDIDYSSLTDDEIYNWNSSYTANAPVVSCNKWFFDQTEFARTVVMDYDLVCDRAWLVQMAYSVSLAAKMLMGIVGGVLADLYGRKPLMVVGACCASTISSERKIFDFSPKHAAKRMSRLPSTLADASESTTATRTCGGRQQTHTPHIICHVSGISVSRCSNANKPCNGGVVLRAIIRHSIYTNSGGGGGVH